MVVLDLVIFVGMNGVGACARAGMTANDPAEEGHDPTAELEALINEA